MINDAADIKARLRANADRLARDLLPAGHRGGNYWIAANPARDDKRAGSFWVWIGGERAGAYCDAASGEKGDVFGLIQLVHGLDFKDALAWARNWLGDSSHAPATRRAAPPILNRAEEEAEAAREQARKLASVTSLFRASKIRPFAGSPADGWLRFRGIDLRALGRQPGILGWLPDQQHTETGRKFPAMIAGYQAPDGTMIALHKTFLAPIPGSDLYDKAPVDPVRKSWPSYAGGVIRLWRGGSGLRETEAAACGLCETLVLTEGIEDGLSLALADPEKRVWAVGALGNLGKVVLPACVDAVVVHVDNDWGKPGAQAQLQAGLAALVRQGRPVSTIRSHIGKDANDALRGVAARSETLRGTG